MYTYPKSYTPKTPRDQYLILSKTFPSLPELNLEQDSSKEGEAVFAIPHWKLLGATYNEAVLKAMDAIQATRPTYDWRSGNWGEQYLRQLPVKEKFWSAQEEKILLISAQFGQRHAGKSVQDVRKGLASNELPFGMYEVLILILTHPERLQSYDDLWIDCPGDEYSMGAGAAFSHASSLEFYGDKVCFDARGLSGAYKYYGSASGFVPHALESRTLDTLESLGDFTLARAIQICKENGLKVIEEK